MVPPRKIDHPRDRAWRTRDSAGSPKSATTGLDLDGRELGSELLGGREQHLDADVERYEREGAAADR